MGKCRNCEYFVNTSNLSHGLCHNPLLMVGPDTGHDIADREDTVYCEVDFLVGREFGCIHHKEKA
jgi:hypothetical protein